MGGESAGRRRAQWLAWWPRSAGGWLIVLPLIILAFLTAIRWFGLETGPLALLISFTPYVAALSVLVLLLALMSRSIVMTAIALACVVLQAAWLVPAFAGASVGDGPTLTVMTSNMKRGSADTDAITNQVRTHHVDLLGVEELTDEAVARLHASGVTAELPYRSTDPRGDFGGNGLWSRYPITKRRVAEMNDLRLVISQVAVDGQQLTVVVAHPRSPDLQNHTGWDRDHIAMRKELRGIQGPMIVAGDLNATLDHRAMRNLQADGFVDAAEQSGAGVTATFPVGHDSPFPLFAIDHVLTRNTRLVAIDVQTVEIPQTDHRALIATYRIT